MSTEQRRAIILRSVGSLAAAAAVAPAGAAADGNLPDANLARYQFTTGDSYIEERRPEFLTDGKIGPENSWRAGSRAFHQMNVFFSGDPKLVGSVHVYSGDETGEPLRDFTILYAPPEGGFLPVPGGAVTNNTSGELSVIFDEPVMTRLLAFDIADTETRVREVAAFPPNGGQGYEIGTGVNIHMARQHRLAQVRASQSSGGDLPRVVADGYVNDDDYWLNTESGDDRWIELDMTDPAETTPAEVRTTTTPVTIGGVHLYTGVEGGPGPLPRGRIQRYFDVVDLWVDVPGGQFSGNTSPFLSVNFSTPVVADRLRLAIDGVDGAVAVREIVPVPTRTDGQHWPEGAGVVIGPKPAYNDLSDWYYDLTLTNGLTLTGDGDGSIAIDAPAATHAQQYQVLLNVGTNTYRIRNRVTGDSLELEEVSKDAGVGIREGEYFGMPHQRWRIVGTPANGQRVSFVNAYSGLAITAGSEITQQDSIENAPGQGWQLTRVDHFPKKGIGGYATRAGEFRPDWAYDWGQEGQFPAEVDYWPMQWGSFNWDRWPRRVPQWKRDGDPFIFMGFNEPDAESQASIPVEIALDMWPRVEAANLPLLAPAPVNPTNDWITTFMDGADDRGYAVDYVAVHWYAGPNADSFMNRLADTRNAFGGLDVMVTEFSVVDWNNTNGWTNDPIWNFFAEVFWRMEKTDWVRRWAIFGFRDDPSNPISDNRGEIVLEDGTLTPEGRLFAAWDGDTTIRTDTPYLLHNESTFRRVGVTGAGAITAGDRTTDSAGYQWVLEPAGQDRVRIRSVEDGRVLVRIGSTLFMTTEAAAGQAANFRLIEAEHGWFYIASADGGNRLRSQGGGFDFVGSNATGTNVRWRLGPVYEGVPGPPRDALATAAGGPEVVLTWAEHGFRDIEGFNVYRAGPGAGTSELIAEGVRGQSFTDTVPAVGVYSYEISAVGDTGESVLSSAGSVSVSTCGADLDGDFVVTSGDLTAAISLIAGGLDLDGDGVATFLDVLTYLGDFDEGC